MKIIKKEKLLGVLMVFCFVFSLFGTAVPTQAAKLTKAQKKAYMKVVKKEAKDLKEESWVVEDGINVFTEEKYVSVFYAFLDVDKNGIKDLVLGGDRLVETQVYTYKKGKVKKILDCGDGALCRSTGYNDKYFLNDVFDAHEATVYKRSKGLKVVCFLEDGEYADYELNSKKNKLKKYGFYDKKGNMIKRELPWKEYRLKL